MTRPVEAGRFTELSALQNNGLIVVDVDIRYFRIINERLDNAPAEQVTLQVDDDIRTGHVVDLESASRADLIDRLPDGVFRDFAFAVRFFLIISELSPCLLENGVCHGRQGNMSSATLRGGAAASLT